MSDLRELYQQLIIDHGRRPRNFGKLDNATHIKQGFNPLCGDKLTFYCVVENNVITCVQFEGVGCAISMASASLMTQALMGKSLNEFEKIFHQFHQLVTGEAVEDETLLGKLMVLAGVSEYPSRVKCATLAWHTAHAAVHQQAIAVSTE